ncbi:DUF1801 domain-containing protein [Mycolicibacterium litorale]|uniref:YdhG-like domain-containing protein n=1 Tax=Mycolicibacterium litorale TaxID=758802 RepID=A0AAD1IN44_9MYCO|nr:DUF1801 domain-containing protein [Mycolicibacterium litorale]MCV7417178.1 DUF1801 domain-containing protein [Mycolicibacterium litorale]TDY04965.1 uncharacterized protein DUF1801 [Mycolicibacterium litorale]BBY18395.1 hypothetical protein MLIT_39870 [Mycolicibacterium litorale]
MATENASDRDAGISAVTDKIAELPAYRDVAARLHEVIMAAGPDLKPRLWYGMPGYARSKSSPVLCFFRVDADDYVSFGLTEKANLAPDEGASHKLIGSAWFLTELDQATEARIAEIVTRAVA